MKFILAFIFAVIFASVQSQLFVPSPSDNEAEPVFRYWKRSSLSNMMRLGKRTEKKECTDCHLGNLMRIGRRR